MLLHMPSSSQPSLLDLFHDRDGRLGVFRRQVEANVLEHLSGNRIYCESKPANDFVTFTQTYADTALLGADTPTNRSIIISPLRNQALTILREKAIETLAKPYAEITIAHDDALAVFTLTFTLRFFKPKPPA
jgi:hypothetical protein